MNHIDTMLQEIGVPMSLKGYRALKEAIAIATDDPYIMETITKGLYPAVAEKVGTTPMRAERCIRHAIETGFNRCPSDVLKKYFGNSVSHKKPTNSEFIATMAAHAQEKKCS